MILMDSKHLLTVQTQLRINSFKLSLKIWMPSRRKLIKTIYQVRHIFIIRAVERKGGIRGIITLFYSPFPSCGIEKNNEIFFKK